MEFRAIPIEKFSIGSWVPDGETKPTMVDLIIYPKGAEIPFVIRFHTSEVLINFMGQLMEHWEDVFGKEMEEKVEMPQPPLKPQWLKDSGFGTITGKRVEYTRLEKGILDWLNDLEDGEEPTQPMSPVNGDDIEGD